MDIPPTRRPPGVGLGDALPTPVGRDVPRRSRVLELSRRGAFGFLINLPIVSYYEIGDRAHREPLACRDDGRLRDARRRLHAVCLRYLVPEDRWSDKPAKISFWSPNIGLAWMCFVTLLPLGVVQLHRSVSEGYRSARELNFLTNDLNALLGWLRLPGDVCSSAAACSRCCGSASTGFAIAAVIKMRSTTDMPLFTEVSRSYAPTAEPRDTLTVHPEAAFLAVYALALTLVAVGLESLGRRSTDPWASPTLAASKPPSEHRRRDSREWPDSRSRRPPRPQWGGPGGRIRHHGRQHHPAFRPDRACRRWRNPVIIIAESVI